VTFCVSAGLRVILNHTMASAIAAAALFGGTAHAAGGAFAADDAGIDEPGACKVESWISSASNRDFAAVSVPACVVKLFLPTELALQAARTRVGGEWGTSLTPKAKLMIQEPKVGNFGLAMSGGATFDAVTGLNTGSFVNVPLTYMISETFKINVNAGWSYDHVNLLHYATYGAGFEWIPAKSWTVIGEVFGLVRERSDPRSLTDPRFQLGVRYTPIDTIDIDVIYGRNITGENANWITVGMNVRFPAPK
jgi:hypothetical protein